MSKSKIMCCVVGCSNSYLNTEGKGIIFYSFPGRPYEKDRREKWISSIRRINEDGTPWRPTKNSRVCSRHFISKKKNQHPAHPDYVPSVFPDRYKKRKADGTERFCRLKKRKELNFEDAGPAENLPEIEAFELPIVDRFEDKCVQVDETDERDQEFVFLGEALSVARFEESHIVTKETSLLDTDIVEVNFKKYSQQKQRHLMSDQKCASTQTIIPSQRFLTESKLKKKIVEQRRKIVTLQKSMKNMRRRMQSMKKIITIFKKKGEFNCSKKHFGNNFFESQIEIGSSR